MAGLARHIDTDELINKLHSQAHRAKGRGINPNAAVSQTTPYSSRYNALSEIPKFKIPKEGAPADAVHQMLKDELDLDGRPNLNLASFVGTYMEKQAEELMIENLSKNMSDADEYPAMMGKQSEVANRTVTNMNIQTSTLAALASSRTSGALRRVRNPSGLPLPAPAKPFTLEDSP